MAKRPTKKTSSIRDRVHPSTPRMAASTLRDHPHNWRKHPKNQHGVMRAVYSEVGFAKPVDVYVAKEGDLLVKSGKLIAGDTVIMDGHLRVSELPYDFMVPVNITDLTEAEAMKYLVTCDPLAALAEQDDAKLTELCAMVDSDSAAIQEMLAGLVKLDDEKSEEDEGGGKGSGDGGGAYQIIIKCTDEDQQRELLAELLDRGVECKSLIG